MNADLLALPAVELARRIRHREISPVDVVEAHVARIQQVNPYLNAVVQERFDAARAEARVAEAKVDRGEPLPPLHGVPCTIKEHYAVAGLPRTAGLLARRHAVEAHDATPVRRLREAGLIVLGTTNVPEALTWYETTNRVYGRTNNPWDLDRIPGGSSGGEAAIVAAGGSPVGLGGDVGGSIRNPAFFCGVPGHKPSGGVVAETGAWPGARGMIGRYKVVGPLARTVADLKAVMPVLAGPDGLDPAIDDLPWGEPEAFDPATVTVRVTEDLGLVRTSRAVRDGVRRAADALAREGYRVERWDPPGLDRAYELWANALEHAGAHSFTEQLANFGTIDLAAEWRRWLGGRPRHVAPSLLLATVEAALRRFPTYGAAMAEQVPAVRAAVEEALGPRGVWLLPAFHRDAPRHGLEALLALPGFIHCAVLNPLELPATAVPVGFSPRGLPVGVQVAARWRNDHLTLDVAERLERALGGWRPAPVRVPGR